MANVINLGLISFHFVPPESRFVQINEEKWYTMDGVRTVPKVIRSYKDLSWPGISALCSFGVYIETHIRRGDIHQERYKYTQDRESVTITLGLEMTIVHQSAP